MVDLGSVPFEALVLRLAGWLLAGCAVWAALIVAALAVEALSRGRLALAQRVGCPRRVRRTVLAACGLAVAAGAAPSYATGEQDALDGLPLPDRPSGGQVAPVHRAGTVHVVRPGECLWSIAVARSSGDPARLAARIYRLNQQTIGADPDLIRPGQRLRLPHPRDTSSQEAR